MPDGRYCVLTALPRLHHKHNSINLIGRLRTEYRDGVGWA